MGSRTGSAEGIADRQRGTRSCGRALGIMLTHPGNSSAQILFEHFGLTARQVLPDKYPAVDADALAKEIRRIPNEPPLPDPGAQVVADAAYDLADQRKIRVDLCVLLAALISTSNPTASAIQTKLYVSRGGRQPGDQRLRPVRLRRR
jgi:hypothetical protein